jgi:hypothetical protein
MPTKKRRINITVEKDIFEFIRSLSVTLKKSMSHVIRSIILSNIEKSKKKEKKNAK